MVTSRDRRRFERAAARARRPSRRAAGVPAASGTTIFSRLSRRVWSRPVVAALLTVAVSATVFYALRSGTEPPKAHVAQEPQPVAVTEPSQDSNERRLSEARQAHLRQLQPVLRADAEKLSEIARRIRGGGRVTDIRKDRSDNAVELRSLFVSHRVLSEDLQNHYQEYSKAKERLRRNVSEQEVEFYKATQLVMTALALPPGAEHRRPEVAWSFLEKCLEKGPGMTLTVRADGYQYTARGDSHVYAGTTMVAEDQRAAFDAFTSFLPDAEVGAQCASLKKRAAGISATAEKLSTEALVLAERTALPGECKYTKPD